MSQGAVQSYANHRRYVPLYHFVASALLMINLIYTAYRVLASFSIERAVHLLTAIALILIYLYARAFAIKVQDRVIRLEERLRLERLLPESLRARVGEFSLHQLIALRFAADGELPALAQKVLDGNIQDLDTIKKQITDWRTDDCRA